jgi:hypothetical protein
MGLHDNNPAANIARFTDIFDEDSDIGRATKAQLQYIIDGQAIEFPTHDMDLGFSYSTGAIKLDRTKSPPSDPRRQIYIPTTSPGHCLPHTMIDFKGPFGIDT